ncbi:condensin complex subunit 1-like [Sitodiplosis mosellana]|uniref:condensin complex subunit 1-like n=1 Tax=Sitodiplosis mosellana TaxID=263140 RepID=UPI00244523F0|nr:condensin complex subunit 1-like [Sitodiplosis mosellana]
MNFEFEIPRNNKELLTDANCSNYFVKQIYDAAEIPKELQLARQAFKAGDAFYIFDHFDTFFSVTENADKLSIDHLNQTVDLLYRTTEKLGAMLDSYLKQDQLDRQMDFLNLTKMVMYLLVSTIRAVDLFVKNNSIQAKSGRKNKKNTNDSMPAFVRYEEKRYDVLIQICNIMQMSIDKLWPISIAEENFVNLVCDLAYRSLSHPSAKEKRVNDVVFQILGNAIKQYRHGNAFPIQIVEIMEREESTVVPIAHGVRYLNDEFGITTVMIKLLRELIEKVNVNPAAQATSKHLSLFIAEVGEISMDLSLQCLEMAQDLLNLEPYAVRISLFGVISTVIIKHLSGEELDDEQKALRDECLDDLLTHMNDISSYVRSKVLQIWNDLKNRNAVPLDWILRIVTRAIERLHDKTATVRKNAITLLRSFLESNPFASKLQMEKIQQKLEEETNKMNLIQEKRRRQERTKHDTQADFMHRCKPELEQILMSILSDEKRTESLIANAKFDEAEPQQRVQKIRQFLNNGQFLDVAPYIIQLDALVGHYEKWKPLRVVEQVIYFVMLLQSYLFDDYEDKLNQQATILGFLKDALTFSETVANAVPKIEEMLMSTTITDVLEAIEFFKTGYLFNINGTENGMRMMLRLLYTHTGQDKNDKVEAVLKAYHSILFGTDATGRTHSHKVVDNLCEFLQHISTGEYTAFGLMIKHWVLSDDINVNIVNVLFERFTLKQPETSSNSARCCMELLILISSAKPVVAHSNKKLIIDIINSRRILEDPPIFAGCLQLLMNSVQPMAVGDKANKFIGYYKRLDDDDISDSIINNFKQFFFYPKLPDFESIASQSIDFLYKMCSAPDLLCQEIIRDVCKKLNEISQKRKQQTLDSNGSGSSQVTELHIPKYLLPRVIFIFGYIATKELVYLHDDVYQNVKYREELRKQKKNENQTTLDGTMDRSLKRLASANTSVVDPNDPDSTYMGATAEDHLAEMINNICENQLIGSADSVLHHFVPVLIEILSQPAKYSENYVQRAAVLALMRFMAVSGRLCADRIGFLMNILRKSTSASMKCNIIIGLADLTSRYPNTIEPWIPNFFVLLFENDDTVRLTTLKMLSYVILQAIIRVTGQVSEIAVCIVDENIEIQITAKEFFRQLVGCKEQEYYKVIPDIVSRLSSNDSAMLEDKFRVVMKYLFELIHKDRPAENLVEKLCSRYRNTNTERQWRDISFCLSLLSPTEKTMKRLIDNLPNYKDKMQYDEIYDCFKTIISNANKQIMKPGLKDLAKEFETKLDKCLEATQNNESIDVSLCMIDTENVSSANKSKNKTVNTRKKAVNSRKNKRAPSRTWSSDEMDDEMEENIPPRRGRKRK